MPNRMGDLDVSERRAAERRALGMRESRPKAAPAIPVIRIPLAGVPAQCPHCGTPAAFPLAVTGNRVHAVCPKCHTNVAAVAVTSPDDSRADYTGGNQS